MILIVGEFAILSCGTRYRRRDRAEPTSIDGQTRRRAANARRRPARVSLGSVLHNWAALVALWALPYLTLLDHLRPDAARSETLQWSLLGIGVLGIASLLDTAWRDTRDPAWRASMGS